MASGDTLVIFTPLHGEAPSSNYATLDVRNGHPVLDYDASTAEAAVFTGVLPRHYTGSGVTVTLAWLATSATSGDVVWFTQFERIDTGTDTDSDSFDATGVSATATTSGTSGAPTYTTLAHSDGARMDSLAVAEAFRLKVTRSAADGSDTMSGDAELLGIEIKET